MSERQPISINVSYPNNPDYEYETYLERIDWDEERKTDIITNNGFLIGPAKGIKKDIKDPDSVFSYKYGRTLKDIDPFGDRYRCSCGFLSKKRHRHEICPICHEPVEFVGDNINYFGWCVLREHYIIQPALYTSIRFFIGKDFLRIIKIDRKTDEDGNEYEPDKPADEPYYGLGMQGFKEKFKEVMDYYLEKNKGKKQDYYDDIIANKDKIFTQSIPVFTTLLRPFDVDKTSFSHEDTNATYVMINKLVSQLNDQIKFVITARRRNRATDDLLYDLQLKLMELYDKVIAILSGKKGSIRSLFGGRYNFTGRDVIVGNPDLRVDEVTLSYYTLIELLSPKIINILQKSYNMTYSQAYDYWWKANIVPDPVIERIIETLITKATMSGRGLPIIIDRNPTIAYGGILQMYCVGIVHNYTMAVPLPILPLMAAD